MTFTHNFKKTILLTLALVTSILVIYSLISYFSFGPSRAELSYTEYSYLGKSAGGVIPASCNSVPPFSHFTNDCPTMCSLSGNPQVKNNTVYSPASNSCVCRNGKTNPPTCDSPNLEIKFGSGSNPLFTANFTTDTTRTSGGRANLSWVTTGPGVISCTAGNAWSGSKGSGGSEAVYYHPSCGSQGLSRRYTLSCNNGVKTINKELYIYFESPYDDPCECDSKRICR